MRKLALMSMGAVMAAGLLAAQTATTGTRADDPNSTNRTGAVNPDASTVQRNTGNAPGTREDTTPVRPPASDTGDQTGAAESQDTTGTAEPQDTTGTQQSTGAAGSTTTDDTGATGGAMDRTDTAEPGSTGMTGGVDEGAGISGTAGASQPGATTGPGGADRWADQPGESMTGASSADRLPDKAAGWLAMLLAGGIAAGAGMALRRR